MFGKRKIIEQQNQLIASQKERLETLEKENAALKEKLSSYQSMENAITRAMTDASAAADRIREDARRESDDIHEAAQKDFMASRKKGETVVEDAHRSARDIIKAAEDKSRERYKQTDEAVAAYVQLLSDFNDSVREQARQADENAQRYAQLCQQLSKSMPELLKELPALKEKAALKAPAEESAEEEGSLPTVSTLLEAQTEGETISTEELLDKSL